MHLLTEELKAHEANSREELINKINDKLDQLTSWNQFFERRLNMLDKSLSEPQDIFGKIIYRIPIVGRIIKRLFG